MPRLSLICLCALVVATTGCPDDDQFGRLNFDGGPPPDAGPAPNDLPINVGDPFTYQGISRTPNGCVGGFIDAHLIVAFNVVEGVPTQVELASIALPLLRHEIALHLRIPPRKFRHFEPDFHNAILRRNDHSVCVRIYLQF